MFNSVALDVVLGLVFIYLLYSLLVSILQEMIATGLGFRAKVLEKAIIRMLENESTLPRFWERFRSWLHLFFTTDKLKDKSFASAFYKHPLIKYLAEDKWFSKPSYLTPKNFSKVMVDLLRGNVKAGEDYKAKIEAALEEGFSIGPLMIDKESDTLAYLRSLWVDANGDVEMFKSAVEQWFNDTMERATGWYKKYVQTVLFLVGMTVAVVFNVDTIHIVEKLSKDPVLRHQLVQQADAYMKQHPHLQAEIDTLRKRQVTKIDTLNLQNLEKTDSLIKVASGMISEDINKIQHLIGLGWNYKRTGCFTFELSPIGKPFGIKTIVGWLLTAVALSLGAPFWFDVLNKLMKLRATAKTDDDKDKKGKST